MPSPIRLIRGAVAPLALACALAAQGGAGQYVDGLPSPLGTGPDLTPVTAVSAPTLSRAQASLPAAAPPAAPNAKLLAAAKSGSITAQLQVAAFYASSRGDDPDGYAQAVRWYGGAVAQGTGAGTNYYAGEAGLGRMKLLGRGTARDTAGAIALLGDAATNGNADAMGTLALAYACGWGVAQNFATAQTWANDATNAGATGRGNTVLATLYLEGWGVPQDFGKAQQLFTTAANAGDSDAMVKLAELYLWGIGTTSDRTQSLAWARKASASPQDRIVLGELYMLRAVNGQRDYAGAYGEFMVGALYGLPEAQGLVAMMQRDALGTDENLTTAQKWATIGSSNGDWRATAALSKIIVALKKGAAGTQ